MCLLDSLDFKMRFPSPPQFNVGKNQLILESSAKEVGEGEQLAAMAWIVAPTQDWGLSHSCCLPPPLTASATFHFPPAASSKTSQLHMQPLLPHLPIYLPAYPFSMPTGSILSVA